MLFQESIDIYLCINVGFFKTVSDLSEKPDISALASSFLSAMQQAIDRKGRYTVIQRNQLLYIIVDVKYLPLT